MRPELPRLELPGVSRQLNDPALLVGRTLNQGSRESLGPSIQLDTVLGMAEVDRLPELVSEVHPQYPEALKESGITGAVELEYVVGTGGQVDPASFRIRSSPHSAFSESVQNALRSARFRPALRSGRATAVRVRQTIRFVQR